MLRVVKLGGSLHRAPQLVPWLNVLAQGGGQFVLVPGGGPFADTVRRIQAQSGISDATAHHMALLAMEQYGLMLCDLEPRLVPVKSPEDFARTLTGGHTPVWLPTTMCLNKADIPENWTVTSDSLAVWLAIRLDAGSLALIKHGLPRETDPAAMAMAGWVDEAFPCFASKFGKPIHVFGLHEINEIGAWLNQPA